MTAIETYNTIRTVVNEVVRARPYDISNCDCDHMSTQLAAMKYINFDAIKMMEDKLRESGITLCGIILQGNKLCLNWHLPREENGR